MPAMSRVVSAVLLLIAASAPAAVVHAEVYKCTEPDGRKVYQDRPCDAGQQAAPYDASRANVTTIDSEASRREAQEALVTRAAGRKDDEDQGDDPRAAYEPNVAPAPVYEPEPVYYPYPVYRNHDHDHGHHGRPTVPLRPDETPMSPPRRGGGGYVPDPPTVRDVAPRPPASSSSSSSRGGRTRSRDDDR
jgi:hypothetical protein